MLEIKKFAPVDHKVKAVVYWASGTGKTVFGWTAPKPIFASAEGGLLSIADKEPAFVEIKSLNDLKSLLQYLQKEKHDFETVVIDSITEINDIIKSDIEKKTWKSMQLQDWGTLSKEIKGIFRGFRDLPIHVLFIAQESNDKDEDKITKVVPSLNWKAASEIAYFMDIVGYLFVWKDGQRKMITASNEKLLTKDRTNLIGNESPIDFSVWVDLAKWIKIKESQETIGEIDEVKEKEEKPLPQPAKKEEAPVKSIDDKIAKELFAVRNEMRTLRMRKTPDELWKNGQKLYTKENSEPVRKSTLLALYNVDSTTKLTEEQARDLIQRTRTKIGELAAMPEPGSKSSPAEEEDDTRKEPAPKEAPAVEEKTAEPKATTKQAKTTTTNPKLDEVVADVTNEEPPFGE